MSKPRKQWAADDRFTESFQDGAGHARAEVAAREPALTVLTEATPMPDGSTLRGPGPALPGLGRTPEAAAPALGAHTRAVLTEFGAAPELLASLT